MSIFEIRTNCRPTCGLRHNSYIIKTIFPKNVFFITREEYIENYTNIGIFYGWFTFKLCNFWTQPVWRQVNDITIKLPKSGIFSVKQNRKKCIPIVNYHFFDDIAVGWNQLSSFWTTANQIRHLYDSERPIYLIYGHFNLFIVTRLLFQCEI